MKKTPKKKVVSKKPSAKKSVLLKKVLTKKETKEAKLIKEVKVAAKGILDEHIDHRVRRDLNTMVQSSVSKETYCSQKCCTRDYKTGIYRLNSKDLPKRMDAEHVHLFRDSASIWCYPSAQEEFPDQFSLAMSVIALCDYIGELNCELWKAKGKIGLLEDELNVARSQKRSQFADKLP